ncbi:MAG: NifB/MoaA-like Fe-S oxidoreductase [Arcobacteraceae bacterium]|jgi:NifB/MoaA-like Fe-S oxidoreductase
MRSIIKLILVLFLVVFINGCNEESAETVKKSETVKEKETEVINGYVLPPEPDETLNNSTLLGIDVNNNGVRDDVEIYVIKRYAKDPDFPKTKTALAMQYAWASQKVIESPTTESTKFEDDALACESYWLNKRTENMTTLEMMKYMNNHEVFNDSEIKDKIYNTKKRIEQDFLANATLSGNILTLPESTLDKCQINIDELGE